LRRQELRRPVVALGVLVLLAGLAVLWVSRGAAGRKGIVFQAKVHGLYQLFTIDPDGSHLEQITHLEIGNSSIPGAEQAAWSPDGKTIIFDSDYQGTKRFVISLFTIKPDGTGLRRVPLDVGQFTGAPTFSPDGKFISFDWDASADVLHEQGIDVANADGSEVGRLTALRQPNVLDLRSNWSPSQPGKDANLYTMKPDGTGLVELTHYCGGRLNAYVGGWSPDGKQIVFHLRGATPDAPGINQLFIVDADGRNVRQLTHLPHGMNPGYASWNPAG
jgi:TolB protein